MGMDHLMSSANPSSGFIWHGYEATEEMKRLQGLRAETMKETFQSTESRDAAIRCPIPCKTSPIPCKTSLIPCKTSPIPCKTSPIPCKTNRWYGERDFRAAQDLSDFIVSKASPPYFMGSPPVRATNPLVHDTQFCAWKVQSVDQSVGIPIPTKGYNARCCVREGSVTKA